MFCPYLPNCCNLYVDTFASGGTHRVDVALHSMTFSLRRCERISWYRVQLEQSQNMGVGEQRRIPSAKTSARRSFTERGSYSAKPPTISHWGSSALWHSLGTTSEAICATRL